MYHAFKRTWEKLHIDFTSCSHSIKVRCDGNYIPVGQDKQKKIYITKSIGLIEENKSDCLGGGVGNSLTSIKPDANFVSPSS